MMPSELNDGRGEPGAPTPTFSRRHAGGLVWKIFGGTGDPVLLAILERPDAPFQAPASILKSGRSSAVARISPYVMKRFHQKRPWNRVLDRIRGDRARRNLVVAAQLESMGIRTAKAVAAAPRIRLGLVACSYLVMEELRGTVTLVPWLEAGGAVAVLVEVGSFLGRLHAAGWSHRDLKA